ncbi:MAG TPA: carboxypeptidase-like regulatory domain-containing protein [Acidobacteriaceae bacterium]|nr:carboxypeptidase-like regulatory domain-containing protein [Acidobacteriaceae bacterium]
MRSCICTSILLAACGPGISHAQVFELSGGSSSLYQADGAQLQVRGADYAASGGMGIVAGRFAGGLSAERRIGKSTYSAGSATIPVDLPTDIFSAGHYVTAIGLGVRAESGPTTLTGFLGGLSKNLSSPFVSGAFFERPGVFLSVQRKVAPGWTASSMSLFGGASTTLESLQWQPAEETKIAVTGGIGSKEPYGAASFSMFRPRVDIKAAYIQAGSRFRRADAQTPISSEPVRENLTVTFRPARQTSIGFTRQNFSTPPYADGVYGATGQNVRSTLNEMVGSVDVAGCSITASGFRSSFGANGDYAVSFSATRELNSRLRIQENYLAAYPDHAASNTSWINGIQEVLRSRWSLSETVSRSNGQNTVGIGGTFLSNFATVSADYETYYIASRASNPFEQALLLNGDVRLPGGLAVTAGTFVDPDGALRYTAGMKAERSRNAAAAPSSVAAHAIGTMVVRGRVLDLHGRPMMGAAILIDQRTAYSDSDGYFCLREWKAHEHSLQVIADGFLDGLQYRVISAPAEVKSSSDGTNEEVSILVERIPSS